MSSKVVLPPYLVDLFLKYSTNKLKIQRGFWAFAAIYLSWRIRAISKAKPKARKESSGETVMEESTKKGRKKKRIVGEVDAVFFARFKRIFQIIVPSLASKEFGLLLLFSGFLVIFS